MFRRLLLLSSFVLMLVPAVSAFAVAPAHQWSQIFGGTSDQYGEAIAIADDGSIFVAGSFWGTVNLGGSDLVSAGATDVFVAKFDAAGSHVWSARFGDSNTQTASAIAVGPAGEAVVAGYFRGAVDFGGGALTSAGANDIFVAEFSGGGSHTWSRRFGASSSDYAHGVAVDAAGNVALTGSFIGVVDFGGGNLTSDGDDAFLAMFTPAGVHRWSAHYGDADYQSSLAVAIGPSGGPVIGGEFGGTVDFGGGALTSAGGHDAFIACFDSLGVHAWSKRFGDTGDQACRALAVGATGEILATGEFAGALDLGGGTLTSAGDLDVFVACLDAGGNHLWSAGYGDAASQTGFAIAVDATGNAYVTGRAAGTIDFGGGSLVSAGGYDIFIASMSATGGHRWSAVYGDTGNDGGYGIAIGGSGMVAATGFARGTVNFGGTDLVCAGGADAFVAAFASTATGIGAPAISGGIDVSVYPNPFNPQTTIQFNNPAVGFVSVVIYTASGSRVATLLERSGAPAGEYALQWDGRDERGRPVGSGVYFARVTAPGGTATRKLIMLK